MKLDRLTGTNTICFRVSASLITLLVQRSLCDHFQSNMCQNVQEKVFIHLYWTFQHKHRRACYFISSIRDFCRHWLPSAQHALPANMLRLHVKHKDNGAVICQQYFTFFTFVQKPSNSQSWGKCWPCSHKLLWANKVAPQWGILLPSNNRVLHRTSFIYLFLHFV